MTTTPDKLLLELAVKAADYGFIYKRQISEDAHEWTSPDGMLWQWNPLIDDGQALRLAVKLHLLESSWLGDMSKEADPYAATRRAIVRAAAKIGESM